MSGILPDIYLPSDMRALQARLLANLQATDQSVRQCNNLDQATRASWGLFYVSAFEFASQDPGTFFFGTHIDQGRSYEQDLYAWQQKIAKTCTLTLPQVDPSKRPGQPGEPGANATLDTLASIVKWTAVLAGVVVGAYSVNKVIGLIPPAKRAA
jgi:hypothetical protein